MRFVAGVASEPYRGRKTTRNNRRVDRAPASPRYTKAGMVLGRDIPCRIEVSMQLEATRPTDEATARTAVVASLVPAAATGLRGMSRINRNHRATPFFGLVRDERTHLRKRPTMYSARRCRFALDLCTTTNVRQVLKSDGCPRLTGLHNLLTQDVIAVLAETRLLASEVSQVPFGRWRTDMLQLTLELEALAFDVLPASCAQKGRSTRDGWLCQAQVNTYYRFRGQQQRRWQRHHNMQIPTTALAYQVGGVRWKARIPFRVG